MFLTICPILKFDLFQFGSYWSIKTSTLHNTKEILLKFFKYTLNQIILWKLMRYRCFLYVMYTYL